MKKSTVMNIGYSLVFTCAGLLAAPIHAGGDVPVKDHVRDLSQFRKNTNVGIFMEEKLDLNGDNKADYVVYSSGGEETYLSVLLANTDGFAVWHFPTAENYKIERAEWGRFQVILEFSTFPAYGSLWGSDKYQWRDYYEITNNSVALVNHKYKQFFAGQQQLYKTRFLELKERQRQMEQTKTDDDLTYVELGRVKALIGRYEEWIKKADAILNAK